MFRIFMACLIVWGAACRGGDEHAVLSYWFGELRHETDYPHDKVRLWFGGGPAVDREIEARFGTLVQRAAAGQLDGWKATPRGRLALVILLDQFPRNIFRGTPQSFAYDGQALALVLEGLDQGVDRQLQPVERAFFYLPLEHSEALPMQELAVVCFGALYEGAPAPLKSRFKGWYDYAVRHRDIIAAYGRFPHRNKILDRASTPAEERFLLEPGSSF